MQFKDILGQHAVKQQLIRCVQEGRIPHAQLLWGDEGCGKWALALAYAQYLNCTQRGEQDSCGQCPSCKQYQALTHPDLHFLFPFVKGEKGKESCEDYLPVWTEFVRQNRYFNLPQWIAFSSKENKQALIPAGESEALLQALSLKSFESAYKTVLLWLPEKMHEACANKLLKLLEEPPAGTVFLLVSEQPDMLLSTLRSRTQSVHVPRIGDEDMHSRFPTEVVHLACGNYLRAVEMPQENPHFERFCSLISQVQTRHLTGLKAWTDDMNKGGGREEVKTFLAYLQHIVRESFVANFGQPELNYLKPSERAFVAQFSPALHTGNIEAVTDFIAQAERDIAQNGSISLVLYDMALKLMTVIKKTN